MKQKLKTYSIDDVEMKIKDLTLDEADEVSSLLTVTRGEATVNNKDSKRFLELVLEPVNKIDRGINFGKCSETTALEVLKAFFIKRIESGSELKNFFITLMRSSKK